MIATHWATMVRPLQNHGPAGTVAGGWRRASREEANISQLISKSQRTQCKAAGWAVFVLDPSSETGPPWTQWHTRDRRERSPVTQVCKSSQQKQLTAVTGKTESQC